MDNIKPASGSNISTGQRGAILFNKTEDRILLSYLVTDVELQSLTRSETHSVSGFGVGAFMLSVAITLAIEWQVNSYSAAIPAMIVSGLVSLCFFSWGIMGLRDRCSVLKEIRASRQDDGEGKD